MAVVERGLITGLTAIVVGVALVPVVSSIVAQANITGPAGTLISLLPFFFALGVFARALGLIEI